MIESFLCPIQSGGKPHALQKARLIRDFAATENLKCSIQRLQRGEIPNGGRGQSSVQ
jgi:hypothetical protein